ncbi:sulfatase-like hydrolase/transferase [soil metagenome]
MKNEIFLKIFVAFLYCICFSCKKEIPISDNGHPDQSKPNIILVLADDIGYEVPSYTGGQSYETVNIDFIANNGIQFCEARATPLCSPSRVEFFTGKYNFRNYVDWGRLPVSNYTIGNLMKEAGYSTCVSGKWQLDGGDVSIKSFGFDHYMVWNPFDEGDSTETDGSHYKNPMLYADGQVLNFINNEYGEDLHRNYLFDFIDSSVEKKEPFFGLWTPNLGHGPFKATPDDPEYVNVSSGSNPKFFPSMIKYLDKEIGMLLAHLDSLKVSENTYIIFTADNGTDMRIVSRWKGKEVIGSKSETLYSWGTHVPFIVYKKNSGIIKIDSSIIDFSDILVTLSDMIGKSLPSNEIFDGISFWPQIQDMENASARTWSFTEFRPQPFAEPANWNRWVEDKEYKLYDSSFIPGKKNQLYRINSDTSELYPVTSFSVYELQKKAAFMQVLKLKKG